MGLPHGATELKKTVRKLNLWAHKAADKSAWIKALLPEEPIFVHIYGFFIIL